MMGMDIGKAIKAWRLLQYLSQEELADRAGLSRQTISRIEMGRNRPGARSQALLAAALGVTIGQLHDGPPPDDGVSEAAFGTYSPAKTGPPSASRLPVPVELPYFESIPLDGWWGGRSQPDRWYGVLHPRARRESTVVLRITGDLMFPTLHEGDLVLVNTVARKPRSGDIVVVSATSFAAVLRCRMIQRRRHLGGDNPSYPPIPLAELENPTFLGIVTALIRRDLR
ncbi:MAG: helix-turn-helix domain-containing protein [Acidobacteria bacterium]|nr:helix-turn-helix domain-containing protein [Acidobacteriota bacterium]